PVFADWVVPSAHFTPATVFFVFLAAFFVSVPAVPTAFLVVSTVAFPRSLVAWPTFFVPSTTSWNCAAAPTPPTPILSAMIDATIVCYISSAIIYLLHDLRRHIKPSIRVATTFFAKQVTGPCR